jgi:hypothetical protein
MKLQLKKFDNQNKKKINIVNIKHYIHDKIYCARKVISVYLLISLSNLLKRNKEIQV